jgi:hypothetical protein
MSALTEKSHGDKLHKLALNGARSIESVPKMANSLPFMMYRYGEGRSVESSDGLTSCAAANVPYDIARTHASADVK